MRCSSVVFAIVLALASPAAAQAIPPSQWAVAPEALARYAEPTPLAAPTPAGRAIADWTSTGLLGVEGGLAIQRAWQSGSNRQTALYCLAARAVIMVGAAEGLKRLVHRTRPDGSDRFSFPSEHTAFATMLTNGGWSYLFPISVGLGRMTAQKHYLSDVLAGAGLGEAIKRIPCQ